MALSMASDHRVMRSDPLSVGHLHSAAAASIVEGIFAVTVSDSRKTWPPGSSRGYAQVNRVLADVSLLLASEPMLIAASVITSGFGYVGTDMTKAWLNPPPGPATRWPRRPRAHQLIGVETLHRRLVLGPKRNQFDRLAAAVGHRALPDWVGLTFSPASTATSQIFCRGPTRTGAIRPASAASMQPAKAVVSHG
jgi:hypothetical protein